MVIRARRPQRADDLALGDGVLVLAHLDFADEPSDRQTNADRAAGDRARPVGLQQHRPLDAALKVLNQATQHRKILVLLEDLGDPIAGEPR